MAGILVGAAGLLTPVGTASATGAIPPDHYCPLTGIPVNGSCSISGPTRIESVPSGTTGEPDQASVKPRRRYDAGGGNNGGDSGGNAGVHGGSTNSNRGN